ncbi:MAG: DegV family protein [Oscillospiraceae bacterium]|jgi:DegV family protein with EDD domain|nr:DegV family protein [Oscillospiraceae bacterium]
MESGIIVDSCCDMSEEMKRETRVTSVPLTMQLDGEEYTDDQRLDLPLFMRAMQACRKKIGSAAPPPRLFQTAIQETMSEYIVTLSDKMSASYENALLGSRQAREETGIDAHVFNSKTGCAGETLIALRLRELINEQLSKARVIQATQAFIDSTKTYFVLENYDNLQKNGRMGKITGSLIHILNIKLIMGADHDGNIALYEKARGMYGAIRQMLSLIERSGKVTADGNLVISHNNNIEFATRLRDEIVKLFRFKSIYIVRTGGLSSLYADNKGVVMAF